MLGVRNPLVVLRRLWYTGGNGIHSPYAYHLVTQVLCCPGCYYADARLYPLADRWLHPRRTAVRKLMFRLANHWQPSAISAPEEYHRYLHEGCRRAQLQASLGSLLTFEGKQGKMVALVDLQRHKQLWQKLKAEPDVRVTFDLYDVGIALYLPNLNRQHYKINW